MPEGATLEVDHLASDICFLLAEFIPLLTIVIQVLPVPGDFTSRLGTH